MANAVVVQSRYECFALSDSAGVATLQRHADSTWAPVDACAVRDLDLRAWLVRHAIELVDAHAGDANAGALRTAAADLDVPVIDSAGAAEVALYRTGLRSGASFPRLVAEDEA